MPSVNRKAARTALKNFLEPSLIPDPVVAVYEYPVTMKDINGIYPIVVISSGGSERERKFLGATNPAATFVLNLEIFIRASDPEAGLTEQSVETKLDDIEQLINDAFANPANVNAGGFDLLAYEGRTQVDKMEMDDGVIYRHELIPVKVRLLHG